MMLRLIAYMKKIYSHLVMREERKNENSLIQSHICNYNPLIPSS